VNGSRAASLCRLCSSAVVSEREAKKADAPPASHPPFQEEEFLNRPIPQIHMHLGNLHIHRRLRHVNPGNIHPHLRNIDVHCRNIYVHLRHIHVHFRHIDMNRRNIHMHPWHVNMHPRTILRTIRIRHRSRGVVQDVFFPAWFQHASV